MKKKKNKLRIGLLTHNYPINSKDRKDAGMFIYDFAHELAKKADVFVFCPDFGGRKEKYSKVPVTWFDWGGGNEKFGNWQLFNPIYVYKFFKLIYVGQKKSIEFAKKNKVDYCLSCWTLPSAIFGLRIKQILKIPFAAWSLGSDVNKYVKIPILGQFIYISLRSADRLYANSFALIKRVEKISGKHCDFMPAITNFELRRVVKVGIDKNCYNFLYVGRLEKVKGSDILLDAIKEISNKKNSFKVNILGGGSMLDELKEKSRTLNIEEFVNFIGWADEEVVHSFMGGSDCLVIPSRSESLPLVAIEAAKTKLPIIATNVGDCKRLIVDYNIGYVVEPENPTMLAGAMLKALKNSKKLKNKSKKGLARMANYFKQEKAVEIFLRPID